MDEKHEILSLLPETLAEDVKNAMILEAAKGDALGIREFLVYQRESWDNSFDEEIGFPMGDDEPRPKWAARCTCGLCGNTWHWGWKNASAIYANIGEDGSVYTGIPEAYMAVEIGEQETATCPYCDQQVIAVSRASLKNGRTYRCLMGRVENLGKYTAVVFWMLERWVDRDAQSTYAAQPWAAVVVGEKKRIYRFTHTTPGCYGKKIYFNQWLEQPHMGEPINSRYYSWEACNKTMMGGFYLTYVPDQTGQTGEKTGLAEYMASNGEFPLNYLLRQKQRPALENLVKAGWTYTVDSAIHAEITGGARWSELGKIADWTKTKPKEMLRMPKEMVARAGSWRWDSQTAALWQTAAGAIDEYTYRTLLRHHGAYELREAIQQLGANRLPRIDAYLQKQAQRYGDRANMTLYRDYRRMLAEAGGGETDVELYPPNLRTAHDRITAAANAAKNRAKDAAFVALRDKWAGLEWSDGSICTVLPLGSAELTREGKMLNHCVGGYTDTHLGGSMIVFIRHARRPERSWYTLNIDTRSANWSEVQLHGYGNEWAHGKKLNIPREVRDFVDRWEKEVLEPVFRAVKAAEKKQNRKARGTA